MIVVSSDGQTRRVIVGVTYHRKVPAKANLNDIADTWRIDRREIDTVLEEWTHEQLVEWLQQFTADELLPPRIRRQRGIG